MRLLTTLLIAVAALGGCTARRGEPFAPLSLSSDLSRRGEEVFARRCHPCHPGGEGGLGPALNNKPLPGFMVKMQVRRGFGVMPSFSEERIDRGELDALVAYLKDLRRQEKPR